MTRITVSVGLAILSTFGAAIATAYTPPYSTPAGITLVDVSSPALEAAPMLLWRRVGDASGHPLYTYDGDPVGSSHCFAECAQRFVPFVAEARARASGDWSIVVRSDHVRQWVYQGRPLYRYVDQDPIGEPKVGARGEAGKDRAQFDPASKLYSPRQGWRRAAFTPEKTLRMPPDVELDALAVANGFGFVDAGSHMTLYAVPPSHQLSSDWQPLLAASLAVPVGDFAITIRKDDAARQWTYRGEALYTYAGDYAPGEVTGIFTGDHSVHAALAYQNFLPPGIKIDHYLGRGPLMTAANGLSLYYVARFFALYAGRETRTGYAITYNEAKSQGTEGCQGDCTRSWKPLLAPANAQAGGFWELVARPEGTKQWAFKGSPVYTCIDDKKAGDIAGNNHHVVVYGDSQGQIIYADAGGDPRNSEPFIGKNITMHFATGAHATSADGAGAAAAIDADATVDAANAAAGQVNAAANARRNAALGTPGSGFYWHTVGVFY